MVAHAATIRSLQRYYQTYSDPHHSLSQMPMIALPLCLEILWAY